MRTLVVSRDQALPITIGAVNGIGIVFEIAGVVESLAQQRGRRTTIIAVRVPIRPERTAKVRDLVRQGPPFEPSTVSGLSRHHVFVNKTEAVFIFEGRNVGEAVERLMRSPRVWLAAADWRDCLAGRPTILNCHYAWSRPAP